MSQTSKFISEYGVRVRVRVNILLVDFTNIHILTLYKQPPAQAHSIIRCDSQVQLWGTENVNSATHATNITRLVQLERFTVKNSAKGLL